MLIEGVVHENHDTKLTKTRQDHRVDAENYIFSWSYWWTHALTDCREATNCLRYGESRIKARLIKRSTD